MGATAGRVRPLSRDGIGAVAVTPELRTELEQRAMALGYRDFMAWAGSENYEMRVADDLAWVDTRVLGIIRGV